MSKTSTSPSEEEIENLAENLLRVDVYFETLSIQNIIESPTYDVSVYYISITDVLE